MQTLADTLRVASARTTSEVQNKTTPVLTPGTKPDPTTDEKSFHQKEMDRLQDDPDNTAYTKAVVAGKVMAKQFLDAVTNIHHPQHEKSFEKYTDQYHLNAKEAEDDFVDQTAAKHNASPYEKKDPGYEDTLLKKYKPVNEAVTEMSMKFYKAFEDGLRQKWFRVGYNGDKAHVDAFSQKYGLPPNMQIGTLKDFQPKK